MATGTTSSLPLSSPGALIGGVVGGVLGVILLVSLVLLLVGICVCTRKHRQGKPLKCRDMTVGVGEAVNFFSPKIVQFHY